MVLGVDWNVPLGAAEFGVNLKGTRYGEVIEPGVPTAAEITAGVEDARDLHIQPDWVVDLAFDTRLMDKKLGITIGVDNMFDQYPDRVPNARVIPTPPGGVANLNATNALGYSRYSPYGFSGRFYFARMSFNW
jgi:iron complex outermembrane receptor protein